MLVTMRRAWGLLLSLGSSLALGWAAAAGGCEERAQQFSYAHDAQLTRRLVAASPLWPRECARAPEDRIGALPVADDPSLQPVPAELVQDMVEVVRNLPRPFAHLFRRHVAPWCGCTRRP
jgi:hypothetical protein